MKLKPTTLFISAALGAAVVTPVQADPMLDLLKVLRDKGTISAQDYELLTNAAKAKETQQAEEKEELLTRVESQTSSSPTFVSLDDGGLGFQSADKAFTMEIGGRIHADYAFIDDDYFPNQAHNSGEHGNDSKFRRARLGIEGTIYTDWTYALEMDFGGGDSEVNSATLGYTGFDNTEITLGRHKMPSGLERLTSSNRISTMERSAATDAFALGRYNGLTVAYRGLNWTATGGAWMGEGFGEGRDASEEKEGRDVDYGYAARFTYAPIQTKSAVVHLGASWNRVEYDNYFEDGSIEDNNGRQRARGGIHFIDRPVQVRYLGTESADTYGLEFAAIKGPFSVQAEYFKREMSRVNYKDADVDGWHVTGTFALTGETRGYRNGVMRTISPRNPVGKGGFGAWELVAQYSEVDLWDSGVGSGHDRGTLEDVGISRGGNALRATKSETWTLGVNWYPTDNIRLMANYVDIDLSTDINKSYDSRILHEGDIQAFMFRAQVAF